MHQARLFYLSSCLELTFPFSDHFNLQGSNCQITCCCNQFYNLKKHIMKKLILAAIMLGSVSCFAYAEKNIFSPANYAVLRADSRHIPASQVPLAVRNSFREMFPGATNVQWSIEREDGRRLYEAEFTRNGRRFKAYFTPDGTFVRVERSNSGSGS